MRELLETLYSWFETYTERFIQHYPQYRDNLVLKKEHTLRVCDVIRRLASRSGCGGEQSLAAEIAALLHDAGRFEQYVRYGTFSDALSEDHGELSLAVIDGEHLLESCPGPYREVIRFAVKYHNKAEVPFSEDDTTRRVTKLLRDADKIDIWHVVTTHYCAGDAQHIAAMLNLPDNDEISDQICEDIREGAIARMEHLRSCNDLKLLQMAWVYDINFPESFRIIEERGYIDTLHDVLPDRTEVHEIYHTIKTYVAHHIDTVH